jgi:SAM-dependent methyltransferase
MLKRDLLRRVEGPHGPYFADSRIAEASSVEDFGLQWREFDPYPGLQALSHSHLFGRFLLPQDFFDGKVVVDLGCGNGRLGQFVLPRARAYIGVELSSAITAFEVPAAWGAKTSLVRASIEDLPLHERIADVVICWGALHHVGDWRAGLAEIRRIVKPGGTVLLYVYPDSYAERENLNRLLKHVDAAQFREFCAWFLDRVRHWATTDELLAAQVCSVMCTSRKPLAAWELIQMFDGLGPEHHHLIEQAVAAEWRAPWRLTATHAGCFVIEAPA